MWPYLLIPAFWLFVTLHNIYRNRTPRQGGDEYGTQWHDAQFCEWFVVLIAFCTWLQWDIVLPLFALCGCLFNGFQNICWKGQKRGWFYVYNKAHPEVTNSKTDRFFMRFGNAERALAIGQLIVLAASLTPLILHHAL